LKSSIIDLDLKKLFISAGYDLIFYFILFSSFYIFSLMLLGFSNEVPILSKEQIYDPQKFDAFYGLFNFFIAKGIFLSICYALFLITLFGFIKGMIMDTLTGSKISTSRILGYIKLFGIIFGLSFLFFLLSFLFKTELQAYMLIIFFFLLFPVTFTVFLYFSKTAKLDSIKKGIKKSGYLILAIIVTIIIFISAKIFATIIVSYNSESVLRGLILNDLLTIAFMILLFTPIIGLTYLFKSFKWFRNFFFTSSAVFIITILYLVFFISFLFRILSQNIFGSTFVYITTFIVSLIYLVWARYYLIRVIENY
jgi:hypothetical protein